MRPGSRRSRLVKWSCDKLTSELLLVWKGRRTDDHGFWRGSCAPSWAAWRPSPRDGANGFRRREKLRRIEVHRCRSRHLSGRGDASRLLRSSDDVHAPEGRRSLRRLCGRGRKVGRCRACWPPTPCSGPASRGGQLDLIPAGWSWASAALLGAAGSGTLDAGHVLDLTPTGAAIITAGAVVRKAASSPSPPCCSPQC